MNALATTSRLLASAGITGAFFGLPLVLAMAWQTALPELEVEATAAPMVALAAVPLSFTLDDAGSDDGADASDVDADAADGAATDPAGTDAPAAGETARPRPVTSSTRTVGVARHSSAAKAEPTPVKKQRRKRVCETPDPGIDRQGPTSWKVDRTIVDGYAKKPGTLNDLGWVSRHEGSDGKADGFRVGGIKCGNDLHAAGLRNGDVVHAVNGRPVTSIPEAIWAYTKLRKASTIEVEITRDGEKRTLSFDLV